MNNSWFSLLSWLNLVRIKTEILYHIRCKNFWKCPVVENDPELMLAYFRWRLPPILWYYWMILYSMDKSEELHLPPNRLNQISNFRNLKRTYNLRSLLLWRKQNFPILFIHLEENYSFVFSLRGWYCMVCMLLLRLFQWSPLILKFCEHAYAFHKMYFVITKWVI